MSNKMTSHIFPESDLDDPLVWFYDISNELYPITSSNPTAYYIDLARVIHNNVKRTLNIHTKNNTPHLFLVCDIFSFYVNPDIVTLHRTTPMLEIYIIQEQCFKGCVLA